MTCPRCDREGCREVELRGRKRDSLAAQDEWAAAYAICRVNTVDWREVALRLREDAARLTGERDKALADRKVLVEALRLVVAFDRARQHPDETGRISVPRLNEILWKCADALRAVGEEP